MPSTPQRYWLIVGHNRQPAIRKTIPANGLDVGEFAIPIKIFFQSPSRVLNDLAISITIPSEPSPTVEQGDPLTLASPPEDPHPDATWILVEEPHPDFG
jgi:hypothetical protein